MEEVHYTAYHLEDAIDMIDEIAGLAKDYSYMKRIYFPEADEMIFVAYSNIKFPKARAEKIIRADNPEFLK
jgi:hypothetical protein